MRSLRTRVGGLVLVALLPAAVLVAVGVQGLRSREADHVVERAQLVADSVAGDLEAEIGSLETLLWSLARHPSVTDGGSCDALLGEVAAGVDDLVGLGVVDRKGELACWALPGSRSRRVPEAVTAWAGSGIETFTVAPFGAYERADRWLLPVAVPVRHRSGFGDPVGVAYALVNLGIRLRERSGVLPPGTSAAVIAPDGHVVAEVGRSVDRVGSLAPEAADLAAGADGRFVERTDPDGVHRLYVQQELRDPDGNPVGVVSVATPEGQATASVDGLLTASALGVGLTLALTALFTWFAADRLVLRPVRTLSAATARLGAGETGVRTGLGAGAGELSELARAFDDMADRIDAQRAALRSREAQLRLLVEHTPVVTYQAQAGPGGAVRFVSPQVEALLGVPARHFDEEPEAWLARVHPDDRAALVEFRARLVREGVSAVAEYRMLHEDGEFRWVRDEAVVIHDGEPVVQGVVSDVTDRVVAERARRASEAHLAAVVAAAGDGILAFDELGTVALWNPAAERLFGWSAEEVVGGSIERLTPEGVQRHQFRELLAGAGAETGPVASISAEVRRRDGSRFWADLSFGRARVGDSYLYTVVVRDLSERLSLQADVEHLREHDLLTGLPNRESFGAAVSAAIEELGPDASGSLAVLVADLDRFQVVNDSRGHDVGDRVLVEVGERIRAAVGRAGIVARLGSDVFGVLVGALDRPGQALELAYQIGFVVAQPVRAGGEDVRVATSIGVSVVSPGSQAEDLVRDAEIALHQAKARGRGRVELFGEDLRARVIERLDIEERLHRVADDGQLRLHFQPEVDLRSGRVVGVEALVRWEHPDRGLLFPQYFIGIAEESDLILGIGTWVLHAGARQAAEWQRRFGEGAPFVSVNLSARQLEQDSIIDDVARALDETGCAPEKLWLELTESVLMRDAETTAATLAGLRRLGVRLAIDDFGTGYSSLAYLKRFPVDVLKVDRAFVNGLGRDPDDTSIVTAVMGLASSLGKQVVAEGVETTEQVEHLRRLGCGLGQGYLFARPRPPAEVEGLFGRDLVAEHLVGATAPTAGGRVLVVGGPTGT